MDAPAMFHARVSVLCEVTVVAAGVCGWGGGVFVRDLPQASGGHGSADLRADRVLGRPTEELAQAQALQEAPVPALGGTQGVVVPLADRGAQRPLIFAGGPTGWVEG